MEHAFESLTEPEKQCTQRALDLLVTTTKGNALNAQFVTENIEIKVIKDVLSSKSDAAEDFRNTTHVLIKNLLFSAKNEQLFSSLLQILFSDPGNLDMCMVILKLFSSVLLESHKVRIMFRRSGGYICLMTLLLQLEGSLQCTFDKTAISDDIRTALTYISTIFKVLTISMRYEPSNARYFLNEVKVNIIISILRTSGAFSKTEKIMSGREVWSKITSGILQEKLDTVHKIFADENVLNTKMEMPMEVFAALFLIKQLFELGMDAFDKQTNDIQWAGPDWLRTAENIETIPLVTWSRSVIVHPTSVLCILQLLPSIEAQRNRESHELDEWSAVAQYYTALLLKALLRLERNQQIMCDHNMPKHLLDVGEYLFKLEKHLLLPPFHYLFERLACQSMHPRELRHFLRLDKPLCCVNLDDKVDEAEGEANSQSGGPLPIHRVKALVSMLTPRNHALVHPPAFVEFDMAIEGFAALFIPSLAHSSSINSSASSTPERLFPPMNGLTFMAWLYLDETNKATLHQSTDVNQAGYFSNIIRLLTIVRNGDGDMVYAGQTQTQHPRASANKETPALENHLTCLYIHLDVAEKQLVVCTEEHSMLDELRRDYVPPSQSETCARISLPEHVCALRQWTHVSVVLSRSLLKPSQIEVYVNGRLLASQKLNYIQPNVGGAQAQIVDSHSVHGFIGTPPFLRRVTPLRWRVASTYLIEDVLPNDVIRKAFAAQPHYVGNFQSLTDQAPLVPEEKILLSLTAASRTEFTLQAFRSMSRRLDTDLCASLMGLSPNDNSTPVRFLWNSARHAPGPQRSLGAAVVGYLGMRTFSPSPVSALLDSIGGAAPLLGLIAMCTDSQGLYASLKVLVSAVQTNKAVAESIERNRLYQTLAVLLEEKIHLVNSHILHLILSLAGTVDLQKEVTVIPSQQTFEDLLCDLELWMGAPDEVKKLLFEHFYELVIDSHRDNLVKVRGSTLLNRLLLLVAESPKTFVVRNDVIFRLIGAIIQPPCDSASLLRFGQALVSTLPTQSLNSGEKSIEAHYPFHIAELERILLTQCNQVKEEESDEKMDPTLYAIYVRNKLLNILNTTLAHTSGTVNSQLCENVVQTLGFGWIMALCAPGIHTNTVYLALRTLLTVTKYSTLLQKFREGSSNNGWLQDADSVLRNRAAVLLGFSVSAHGGAVGSHVDVNPELSSVSGLAALEQLICAHADQPFAYLTVLALLFNQHDANIQPIEEFNVDLIWSHVFALSTNSSVYDAIAKVEYCPEALIPLISMLRAGLHYSSEDGKPVDDNHWSRSYPIMVVQLLTFLYQNLENFVPLCHNETFVISLFTSLIPPRSAANTPQCSTPVSALPPANQRCAKSVLDLLANILLNDLCLQYDDYRTDWLFDHLVDYLEGGGAMHSSQSSLFTELVNTCLDHFMASDMFFANSSLNIPKSTEGRLNPSSEQTAINVIHFLSRVIDSVWNCLYRGNPVKILKCFLKLLAESHTANKAAAQLACTDAHLNALFRIVLYLLSRPIDNVDTQTSVVDTLAEIIRNQHILLSANSNNPLFYGALVHLVFMLSEPPDLQSSNKHLERGSAQVSVCAQSVWGILWQQKKQLLEEIFKRNVELDLYSARAACGESANRYWLQFVDVQAQGNANLAPQTASLTSSARQVGGQLQHQIQSRLSRVARSGFKRLTSRKSMSQEKQFFQV
uniref:Mediator of RNA polymerase II transcription subunit 23 n=1 Tax=Bursaphelenchus xylophilus TaxID=6326 RepID=A0A1I7RU76_BURXY